MRFALVSRLVVACALAVAPAVLSAEDAEFRLVIRDHKFEPSEISIPAGQKVKLLIENQDATAEEFESHELNREKVVPGKGKVIVFVGPLKAGRYPFFGDFHKDTAKGTLIVQ